MGEMWMNLADAREKALGRRATNAEKQWSEHTKALPPLKVGDSVMVQIKWAIIPCDGTRGGPLSIARGLTSTR